MNWYLDVLKKYATFSGRARRKEYWMFTLISFIVSIALSIIGAMLNLPAIGYIYSLAVLLPCLGVMARRLHDTGRSGWWILLMFIPIIGAIALLIFFCQDSEKQTNTFGPNPKAFA